MVVRVLGARSPLEMTLRRFEPPRLVEYTSTQPGVPDARHERHFEDAGGELHYRIAVEFEPRGLYDRIIVRRGDRPRAATRRSRTSTRCSRPPVP